MTIADQKIIDTHHHLSDKPGFGVEFNNEVELEEI